jgi:hypothetical protein
MKRYLSISLILLVVGIFSAIYFSWTNKGGGSVSSYADEEVKSLYVDGVHLLNKLNQGEKITIQNEEYVDVSVDFPTIEKLTQSLEQYYTEEAANLIIERLHVVKKDDKLYVRENVFEGKTMNDTILQVVVNEKDYKEYELQYKNDQNQTEFVSISAKKVENIGWRIDSLPF